MWYVIPLTIMMTTIFIVVCYLAYVEHCYNLPMRAKLQVLDDAVSRNMGELERRLNALAQMLGYMPAPDDTNYGGEPAKTVNGNGRIVDNTNGEYDSQDAKDAWELINNATVRFRDRLDTEN